MSVWRDLRLLPRTSIIIALVMVLFFAVSSVLEYRQQRAFILEEAIEKARLVAAEAIRAREYLSVQLSAAGVDLSLESYGLIPVVASQRIGEKVGQDLGYRIRQVSLRYRNPKNAPDPFEVKILNHFLQQPAMNEEYAVASVEGEAVFRYLQPFRAEESCLRCHGEPESAPEFIRQLFPPENSESYHYQIGEIIGAASVTIPMERLQQRLIAKLTSNLLSQGGVFLALILCLGILTRFTVTAPLGRFNAAIRRIVRTGRFDEKLAPRGRDEIGQLMAGFNEMLDHLTEKSRHIEESEQRYRALTESARDPIISFLPNGQIILFNRQAERVFGYSQREALGLHIGGLIPALQSGEDERWGDDFLASSQKVECRRRDGGGWQMELTLTEVEVADGRFFTAVLRDPR